MEEDCKRQGVREAAPLPGNGTKETDMDFMGLMNKILGESKLEKMALRIADQCRDAVQRRVGHQFYDMGSHEAIGYVRARAAAVVRMEVATALSHDRTIRPALRSSLVELVSDAVVAATVRELSSPVVATLKFAPAALPVAARRAA